MIGGWQWCHISGARFENYDWLTLTWNYPSDKDPDGTAVHNWRIYAYFVLTSRLDSFLRIFYDWVLCKCFILRDIYVHDNTYIFKVILAEFLFKTYYDFIYDIPPVYFKVDDILQKIGHCLFIWIMRNIVSGNFARTMILLSVLHWQPLMPPW